LLTGYELSRLGNFLPRSHDAIREMHSRCIVIRRRNPKADTPVGKERGVGEEKRREENATPERNDVREKAEGEGRGNEAYETLCRVAEEGISGHYFLQYFNVKSSGFLEPHRIDSCRRNQAVALAAPGEEGGGEGRERERERESREQKGVGVPGGGTSGGNDARGVGGRAPRGAFPAMQSLKGEPRHYAVAAVHGPLPYHPFDSSSSLVASLFLLPLLLIAQPLSLSPSLLRPGRAAGRSRFSYFIGEKASPPYIPTPTAYGALSIRSRSNDT